MSPRFLFVSLDGVTAEETPVDTAKFLRCLLATEQQEEGWNHGNEEKAKRGTTKHAKYTKENEAEK